MDSTGAGLEDPERRVRRDRRRRPTGPLDAVRSPGRRLRLRRAGDAPGYVDRFRSRVVAAVIVVLLLSCFDAYFTLRVIEAGGREVNPLMDGALRGGLRPFLTAKLALTVFGLLLLALHHEWRLAERLLAAVLLGYSGLIGYHLWLLHAQL